MEEPQRTDRENIRHKLEDIIIIGLCTLICNGEELRKEREEWPGQFLALPNGIPDSVMSLSWVGDCESRFK